MLVDGLFHRLCCYAFLVVGVCPLLGKGGFHSLCLEGLWGPGVHCLCSDVWDWSWTLWRAVACPGAAVGSGGLKVTCLSLGVVLSHPVSV